MERVTAAFAVQAARKGHEVTFVTAKREVYQKQKQLQKK
jgi:hypothetical protein